MAYPAPALSEALLALVDCDERAARPFLILRYRC